MIKIDLTKTLLVKGDHFKFKDPDYTDNEVEGLMKYFHLEAYEKLIWVLKTLDIRRRLVAN